MARTLCQGCQRPLINCICSFCVATENTFPIVILQHPKEVKHSKGSLPLLANSLTQCQVIIDENFTHNETLNDILASKQAFLLYPHEKALLLEDKNTVAKLNEQQSCLVLIDATWRKAYRMYMLSKNLHGLPKLQLPAGYRSLYTIRKTSVKNGLSTLEACCYALSLLENNEDKYKALLEGFTRFNEQTLSFHHRGKNSKCS